MNNLSEEEKSAIKHLEHFMNRIREEKYLPEAEIALDTSIEDVLYLIEKQQKEIEEKTTILLAGAEKVKQLEKEIEDYKKFKKDIVSKIMFWDKEELPDNERIISMLDTFMKEVSRLEDIEDKKVEVAVDFIEEKRDKYWKDKIREKIKELEGQKEKIKYDGNRCFADYEQFCNNLKFFKEQMDELLKEK